MPQSTDFRSYQDTSEDFNTNMLQPEEWEGHGEDAGRPPSGPPSISSSKYSTKSRSDLSCLPPPPLNPPTPSYKHRDQQANASSTKATTFSLYPTNHILPPASPSPSYKSRDPIFNTISASTSVSTTFTNSTNRIIRLPPRGVSHFNPATNKNWLQILQSFLSYTFNNPDILEEALETPKNGVTCVGKSMRICLDGNEGLAKLGETAIRLVMREQFYLFSIPEELVKEDTREDNTRIISKAVRAVIGAVYLDGGSESAKKIMENLQMGIKLPPGSKR
ncbi:hypothetical protein H4I96_01655 [Botrytis cinerea]